MAFVHLKIGDVVEDRDNEGKPRVRVEVTEVKPREFMMNLSKADAGLINQFRALKGQLAMVPAREGMMNGRPFLSLDQGDIIPLPGASSISTVNPVKELDPVQDKPRSLGVPNVPKSA